MAEKCLRPGDEEDADEEGEEAAEAPVRVGQVVIEKDESTDEDEYEEAAVADSPPPPPPGEAEEVAVPDSPPPPRAAEKPALPASPAPKSPPLPPPEPSYPSPPPAVPEVPSYPPLMPVYPTVSPAFYPMPPSVSGMNLFANDGSFMELFKKKMEASSAGSKEESEVPEEKKPEPDKRKPVSFVGKRRGGAKLALKTGIVAKKPKTEEEEILTHKGGAWAQYMAEVKKYKAHQCSDDDKTRPLVK